MIRELGLVEHAMHLLDERRGSGHLVRELVMDGPCDLGAMQRALEALRRQYAVLRVEVRADERPYFVEVDGEIDLGTLPSGPSDPLVEAQLNRPLQRGETLRVAMRPEHESRLRLVLAVRHSVLDGRWLNRICSELVGLYERELAGHPPWRSRTYPVGPPLEDLLVDARVPVTPQRFAEFTDRQVAMLEASPPCPLPMSRTFPRARSRLVSGTMSVDAEPPRGLRVVSALGAGLLLGARRLIPAEGAVPLSFATTADVGARLRTVPIVPGAYLSGVRTIVGVDPSIDSVAGLAGTLGCRVRQALDRGDAEFGVLAQEAAVEHHLASGEAPAAVTVSYLGRIPTPETFVVRLSSLRGAVPMHGFGPTFYCHAALLADRLLCQLVYPDPYIAPAVAETTFSTALDNAARILSGSGSSQALVGARGSE